ncbi:hypothetical protein Tco_0393772 [Tanacetum coccineum]
MADLIFAHSHNMVAYLEKSEDNTDFAEIVEFLNASPIRNLDPNSKKFLMYPRFLPLFLNNQIENLTAVFDDEYDTPSHTKKVFANMRRRGKDFSGTVTPLFDTMLIQSQAVEGEVDETVHEERGDSVERAVTTATSLDAEQGSGDRPAQTRVLDLENVKDGQALEIKKLKKRVKKLKSKKKSRTPQLKRRLFKLQEDSETRGRYGHDIRVNTASTLITTTNIKITIVEPVTTSSAPVTTAGVSVSTVEPSTPPTTTMTTLIEDEYLTIAQTFMKMKSEKSKAKGVTMQEPSESGTRVRVHPLQIDPKDKAKVKMVEPEKLKKKKDQIKYDADVAQRLQAELEEEARLEREKEKEASKAANITE